VSAAPSTKLQVNLKSGQALVNVYADDPEELAMLLSEIGEKTGQIASLQAEMDAAYRVTAGLGAASDVSSQGSGQQPARAAQGGPGPAPHCAHGARVYVSSRTQKDIPFEAWDCPSKGQGGCANGADRTFISYNGKPSGNRR
jgi:hypothetical protein